MHAGTTGLEEVEGAVAHPGVFLGDHTGVADVGLAHLQEHSAGSDQTQ